MAEALRRLAAKAASILSHHAPWQDWRNVLGLQGVSCGGSSS